MSRALRLLAVLGVLVVGVLAGAATVLLHQWWWGLALGVAAVVAALVWLPRGWLRAAVAVGWCTAVARGTLARPEGDYLVPGNDRGWALLGASLGVLLFALATPSGGGRRAADPGDRASPT